MRTSHAKPRRAGRFGLNVRDLVGRPGTMREAELDVVIGEHWGEGLVRVPTGARVHVDVRLESVHEGILASGTAATTGVGQCSRCLIDIAPPVEVEFQELFAYPGQEASDFEVQDDHVDLETEVRDAVVISLPFQPVCRPDCPGLDAVTGRRLADMAEATPDRTVDPRWAVLAEFAFEPQGRAAGPASTPESR